MPFHQQAEQYLRYLLVLFISIFDYIFIFIQMSILILLSKAADSDLLLIDLLSTDLLLIDLLLTDLLFLISQVSEQLFDSLGRMFCDVDTHMESSSSQLTEVTPFAGEKLFQVAVFREEDSFGQTISGERSQSNTHTEEDSENERRDGGSIDSEMEEGSTLRPRIAFISFNGDPFQYDESEEQEEEKGERGERPIEKER